MPRSEHQDSLQQHSSRTRTMNTPSSAYPLVANLHASTGSTEFKPAENFFPFEKNGGSPISIWQVSSCIFRAVFRLFSAFSDISHQVQQFLIEEYSNEAPRTDGEIYRKIRQYYFQRNLSFEMRWWARLRGNRAKNLKALLRHDKIRSAFDALLDVTGLWQGMQLTTIHKMMALKFDDVCPDRG